ncbi:hypothetical protein AURDEDRAFT_121984 [Auricularia subglabra TFB-10046 SS5]|nr:hypothetical protein AURDEDRAFT_121984 [Auricularia subglabra TFB-10046 SS5]
MGDLHSNRFKKPATTKHTTCWQLALSLVFGIVFGVALTYVFTLMPTTPPSAQPDDQNGTAPPPHEEVALSPVAPSIETANAALDVVDATPNFDHALFRNGARIITSLTSPSIRSPVGGLYSTPIADKHVGLIVHESRGPPSVPEVALGLYSDERALWFFNGAHGTLTVALPAPVLIRSVVFKPHPIQRSCLPLDVNIWGLIVSPDSQRAEPEDFPWPATAFPLQLQKTGELRLRLAQSLFVNSTAPCWMPMGSTENMRLARGERIMVTMPSAIVEQHLRVHIVAIEFRRNGGSDSTCFPGLSVHDSEIAPSQA